MERLELHLDLRMLQMSVRLPRTLNEHEILCRVHLCVSLGTFSEKYVSIFVLKKLWWLKTLTRMVQVEYSVGSINNIRLLECSEKTQIYLFVYI